MHKRGREQFWFLFLRLPAGCWGSLLQHRYGAFVISVGMVVLMTLYVFPARVSLREGVRDPWLPMPAAGRNLLAISEEGRQARSECSAPGAVDKRRYGRLHVEDLPWYANPPERLTTLMDETGADLFVDAFRTTLPEPLFEEQYNIARAAELLAGTVVQPGDIFSMNETVGPYTKARGYRDGPTYVGTNIVPSEGGGVCKIASTLYNIVVFTDMKVVERHQHSMLVPYVPPGRDATVAYGVKDFRFQNNRAVPLLIWSAVEGDTLYIAFYGRFSIPSVVWGHEELHRQKANTLRRVNRRLNNGEEKVLSEGADGVTVRTWVDVTYEGKPTERREMGTDSYRPMPRIVEYGR